MSWPYMGFIILFSIFREWPPIMIIMMMMMTKVLCPSYCRGWVTWRLKCTAGSPWITCRSVLPAQKTHTHRARKTSYFSTGCMREKLHNHTGIRRPQNVFFKPRTLTCLWNSAQVFRYEQLVVLTDFTSAKRKYWSFAFAMLG